MTLSTVPAIVLGDPLTSAWGNQYLVANINEILGRATGNHLVNGGFEWWQRGAGSFTANLAYAADRWQLKLTSGTLTVTQETTTIDVIQASSLKAVSTSPVGQQVVQRIEDVKAYRGKTIAFSIRVQQSVGSGCAAFIADSSSTSTSSTTSSTGSFQTVTITKTIASNATTLDIGINFTTAGTYYFDNAMLVIGPNATEYVPLHPQEDLARCQRYYEVHGGANALFPDLTQYASASQVHRRSFSWHVQKGGVPTVTKNGTWGVLNCGQPSVAASTPNGYTLECTATGAGLVSFSPNSSDDTITGEWNP